MHKIQSMKTGLVVQSIASGCIKVMSKCVVVAKKEVYVCMFLFCVRCMFVRKCINV